MECKLHPGQEMRQMWKKSDPNHTGESWYSHKLENGSWCNGKEKKEGSLNVALLSTAVAQLQASNARIEQRLDKMAEFLKRQNWPGGIVEEPLKTPTKNPPF